MRAHTPKPERRNANERRMPDLRRTAGISGDGCADAVRDLPQKRACQDALRKRALRVQRLPYAGAGQHRGAVPARDRVRSGRHCRADDGAAKLPYARAGAPCDGRRGAADGVSQRWRRHCPFRRAHGDAAPRQKRARRRVRLLGRVRRGDQHGDVRLDHLRVNAADRRAVCAVAQNDGGRARADRRDRRSALLQARLLPVHSHGDRFCEGALRHRAAKAGGRVPLRRAEQSVHRKALSLQRGKPLSACRRAKAGFSERSS